MSKPFECVQLPCPKCGEADANLSLHLKDGSYSCEECGSDFERADVEDFIRRWSGFLAWLDTCPVQR
jgi:transcription elongation factor Elf1